MRRVVMIVGLLAVGSTGCLGTGPLESGVVDETAQKGGGHQADPEPVFIASIRDRMRKSIDLLSGSASGSSAYWVCGLEDHCNESLQADDLFNGRAVYDTVTERLYVSKHHGHASPVGR